MKCSLLIVSNATVAEDEYRNYSSLRIVLSEVLPASAEERKREMFPRRRRVDREVHIKTKLGWLLSLGPARIGSFRNRILTLALAPITTTTTTTTSHPDRHTRTF